jgi:V/A-type H+-transporting ATPase subunit K
LVTGFHAFNFITGMMAAGLVMVWLASPSAVLASGMAQEGGADPYITLAAALSTGLASIGAGIAVGGSGAAAVGATAEKPESFGRSLIFVGLSEGIAIYGLMISFIILGR